MAISVTMELVMGWLIVGGAMFLLGEYTDVLARAAGVGKVAGRGAKKAGGNGRALTLAAFVGGLWAGPMVLGFLTGTLAGVLGGVGLAGLAGEVTVAGYTLSKIEAGIALAGALIIGGKVAGSAEEDDD